MKRRGMGLMEEEGGLRQARGSRRDGGGEGWQEGLGDTAGEGNGVKVGG